MKLINLLIFIFALKVSKTARINQLLTMHITMKLLKGGKWELRRRKEESLFESFALSINFHPYLTTPALKFIINSALNFPAHKKSFSLLPPPRAPPASLSILISHIILIVAQAKGEVKWRRKFFMMQAWNNVVKWGLKRTQSCNEAAELSHQQFLFSSTSSAVNWRRMSSFLYENYFKHFEAKNFHSA